MTLLEKLSKQVNNILEKHHNLKSENIHLKEQLNILSHSDESIVQLKEEKKEQDEALMALASRLEQLLKNQK